MKYSLLLALVALGAQAVEQQKITMVSKSKTTSEGKWIPDHYSTDEDDQLMKNLIEQGLAYTKDKGFDDKYMFKTEEGCGCSE